MTSHYKRRQLFVHPDQYWFVATTLIYFSSLMIVLVPMVQPLEDPSVTWQERAQLATQFLDLNARVWPWLLVTFLGLLLHSMYFMHRIVGHLYRVKVLFRTIGSGHLCQRAKLREHDYLHREARDFNAMVDSLEQKIEALNLHCAFVTQPTRMWPCVSNSIRLARSMAFSRLSKTKSASSRPVLPNSDRGPHSRCTINSDSTLRV